VLDGEQKREEGRNHRWHRLDELQGLKKGGKCYLRGPSCLRYGVHANGRLVHFSPVSFLIVLINLPDFFIPYLFMGSIAKRLISGETAHADPNGFFLRLYLERS
jgi:hypothetical protein